MSMHKKITPQKMFWRVCILMMILNLLMSFLYRTVESPSFPEEEASSLASLGQGILSNLYAPYFVKKFMQGHIQFALSPKYHRIPRVERFLTLPFLLISIAGIYLLVRKYGLKIKVHPILLLFIAILTGSILSNKIESFCFGAVVNYIKMNHSFVVRSDIFSGTTFLWVIHSIIFNSADLFLAISVIGLFWTSAILTLKTLWKIKQKAIMAFTILLLLIILCSPLFSTPYWVVKEQERLNRIKIESCPQDNKMIVPDMPNGLFGPNTISNTPTGM